MTFYLHCLLESKIVKVHVNKMIKSHWNEIAVISYLHLVFDVDGDNGFSNNSE